MKRPICKSESDLFYRYIYFVFNKAVCKAMPDVIDEDMMAGTLAWKVSGTFNHKKFDEILATPLWECNDRICVDFVCDELVGTATIPFPLDGWTMDVDRDVERYILAVQDFLSKVKVSPKEDGIGY